MTRLPGRILARGHVAYSAAMVTASPTTLLEAALTTWRHTGAPEDAAMFEARARAALAGWTPPATSSPRTFQRAWLHAVKEVVGRCWAIETLTQQLPGDDWAQRAAALAKRVEALVRHGPDPRFRRVLAAVRDWEDTDRNHRLSAACALLRETASPQDATAVPVVARFPPPTRETTALWQAVYADPDDDGSLAVLADALQLAGDPRGEVMALQLAPGGDEPAQAEQLSRLIASCGAAWLGRLTQVTGAASFERGAVRRLELASERKAHHDSWDALIADPALETVADLLPGNVDSDVYARFITSGAMRSLARIEIFDARSLAALAHAVPSVTHVACVLANVDEVIAALPHRHRITSIAIAESAFELLKAASWFRRLTAVTLGVGTRFRRGLARWAQLSPPATLTLVPDIRLPACARRFPWDFGVTLAREGDATVAQVSGEWLLLPIDVLTALPPDVVRIEVDHPSPAMADRIASAIARPAVEVVHRPTPRRAAIFVPTQRDLSGAS
jgi:uncharacterized protein (TIGR02996 family)